MLKNFNDFLKILAHFFCKVVKNNKLGIKKRISKKRLAMINLSLAITPRFETVKDK